jgi:hypothetical protein
MIEVQNVAASKCEEYVSIIMIYDGIDLHLK